MLSVEIDGQRHPLELPVLEAFDPARLAEARQRHASEQPGQRQRAAGEPAVRAPATRATSNIRSARHPGVPAVDRRGRWRKAR